MVEALSELLALMVRAAVLAAALDELADLLTVSWKFSTSAMALEPLSGNLMGVSLNELFTPLRRALG